jgi:CubicO group peptidase (beta-lactamase class C family)
MTRREILFGGVAMALEQGKLDEAVQLIQAKVNSGEVAAAALSVHQGTTGREQAFGKATNSDAVFLLASLTKPMTTTALMVLVDRGKVSLSDPVQRFIPEFKGGGRDDVRIRHLITHTSGLPDMLPENTELRKQHAPLSAFVAGTCRTPLLFKPGSELRYQSMGILLAAEIAARVTKQDFPSFLDDVVFRPLGMRDTSLGLGSRKISSTMQCQVDERSDWDWNSSYWRNLASPWGGAHSTVKDVTRFLRYFAHPDTRVLEPQTAKLMITDQVKGLSRRWGLGWMLNNGGFGTGCSAATFGHEGSTGTLCWLDPKTDVSFVLLTTEPAVKSSKTLLEPVSQSISTTRG